MKYPFEVVDWALWDGSLTQEQAALYSDMKPVVDDMHRIDDPVLDSWYEHCQWKWKQREYAWVLEKLGTFPVGQPKVLDAGCGYTALIRYLASKGFTSYGFDWDIHDEQSDLGRSSALMYGNLVNYHRQDIRSMKWPSDYFDTTVCVSVLEHLWAAQGLLQKIFDKPLPIKHKFFHFQNIDRALQEFIRVTKKGGAVILTMDCGYGGGIPVPVIEKLFGVTISNFPSIETIRSYWLRDHDYMSLNRIYPSTAREYTSFMAVLRKL